MRNKVWKRAVHGQSDDFCNGSAGPNNGKDSGREETATLAENETDSQMLFDEAVKDAMIIDAG